MNYNLLVEPWIPVLMADGEYSRVSIREAFAQAGRIRQIAAPNPMDRVATLRFLLALLYWCKGNPTGEENLPSGDSFPADWFSHLDDHADCFNLLGEGKRFYQYQDSKGSGAEKLTANYLAQEVPTGTNTWHFRHSTDKVDGLCPACCARGLLRLPLFATSGGRGKPPGVNAKPPLYVIPVGNSLAETLVLSWQEVSDLGIPAWERPELRLPQTGLVPLLPGLTWLPRRVWLDDPGEPKAACLVCGRMEHLIRSSVFAPIGSTKTDDGGPGRVWRDPHVIYETSAKGEVTSLHAANVLGASDAASGQWSRIMAGVLRPGSYPGAVTSRRVWVVGFATVQNDKYLEAMERLMYCDCVPDQVQAVLEGFDHWRKEGNGLANRVRPPKSQTPSRKHVEIRPMVAAIRPHVENRVSLQAAGLLSGEAAAWEQAATEYRVPLKMIANAFSPGFTAAALRRRRQIESATPDMRPRPDTTKKRNRKGGGDS